MSAVHGVRRIGMFAVALGVGSMIGAATAAAAPEYSWVQPADLIPVLPDLTGAAADTSAPEENLAIALFGIPVFQEGTAHVAPGFGSGFLAIAEGANSFAQTGGLLDTAIAIGDDSRAAAAGIGNVSIAVGDDATAAFGGYLSPIPFVGWPIADGAFAFGDHSKAGIVGGSFNTAAVFGDGDTAVAGNGIFNAATVFGDGSTALAGENPDIGNAGSFDLAAVDGDGLTADATGGIFRVDLEPLFSSLGWVTD